MISPFRVFGPRVGRFQRSARFSSRTLMAPSMSRLPSKKPVRKSLLPARTGAATPIGILNALKGTSQ